MRLAPLALSAALLSGCSYAGGSGGNMFSGLFSGPSSGHYQAKSSDRCLVPHQRAPIPRGCHPSQVKIGQAGQAGQYGQAAGGANAGGFPQTPQFGAPTNYRQSTPQYATGQYGTHASGNQHTKLHQGKTTPKIRRPRFRGALDLGIEQSVSGSLIDTTAFPTDPFQGYDPAVYNEGRVEGSRQDGSITTTSFYANSRLQNTVDPWDSESTPTVSFKDAWSTPSTIGLSGEYILNNKATVFARGGYTRAEGTSGGAATLDATVFRETRIDSYDPDISGVGYNLIGTTVGTEFNTENIISEVSYDFSDMERYDLEAGGRFYLNPVAGQATGQTITPFIGASGGLSHFNSVSYTLDQRQLSYGSIFEDENPEYYDIDPNPTQTRVQRQDLYEAQWVPSGRLSAGVEWQVTPKTALAFETAVRFEGAREYTNGAKGDKNISVPLTLRGSFNF